MAKVERKVKVNITQEDEQPVEKNVLARAILNIAGAVQALQKDGLTFEAIVVLTHHNCRSTSRFGSKPGVAEVRAVLRSLGELRQRYCV